MKLKNLILFISFICLSSCTINHKSESSQLDKIVSLDNGIVSIASFTKVLEATIGKITSSNADNFILFIHGRGKHPQKAFEKKLLVDLEKNYSAKVIMFHWPSWQGKFSFPVVNARNAANDFNTVIKQISIFKSQNRDKLKDIKFTLLSNSMGSFVLEQSMLIRESDYKNLFDTVVINAAASSAKKHAKWVNKIQMSENIYITFNTNDKLLDKIGIKLLHKRLGKGLSSMFGHDFTLSERAKYIDMSQFHLNHRYYLHRDFHNQTNIQAFYDAVLNGNPAVLDLRHGVNETKRQQVYIINP